MFMRLLQLQLKSAYVQEFKKFYESTVFPELQKLPGCIFAGLIKSSPQPDEFVSLTFWKTQVQAEQYEKSGAFNKLFEQAKPFLSDSTEWKIHLSDNMELQYGPEIEEPVIKKYIVMSKNKEGEEKLMASSNMFVRILSLVIQDNMVEEFKELYTKLIMPSLRNTKGCQYVFLTESVNAKNEFISVTIWKSKEDADEYEFEGQFQELTDKVKHTFSQLYLWGMSLEKEHVAKVKTSDDFKLGHYKMVTGKSFL
jgi:heme-degrading monooxygenase HmoA